MSKRIISWIITIFLLIGSTAYDSNVNGALQWLSSGDTIDWTRAYPNNNQNDYLQDQ